tara:strand:+ start:180 stop:347 length:168 start_codon:yes stop_codon:yes gene_type:complete
MYGSSGSKKKQMNHDSTNFSKNDKQFLKNTGTFSSKGMKQMPQNVTFGKISKRHT